MADDSANSEAVAASLAAISQPGSPWFVLVDPLVGEPLPIEPVDVHDLSAVTEAREHAWMRPVQIIELAPVVELPGHQHPYLVELDGPEDPWLGDTVEMALSELARAQDGGLAASGAAVHRIGGWLQTSLFGKELAGLLSAMMRVNTEAATSASYLRLADRRAFGWLRQIVGDERIAAPFGPLQRWCYLDVCGQLAQVPSRGEQTSDLRLTHEEWAAFMQSELLHPAVARWLGERAQQPHANTAAPLDARTCYSRGYAALERVNAAQQRWPQRITKLADRTAWAALCLLHPDIEACSAVVDALDAPAPADEPLDPLNALAPTLSGLRLKASP